MPTYDFICLSCNERFEVFLTFSEYGKKAVLCTVCGSDKVRRRMTKVRLAKSEESRMEGMLDPSALEGLEDDPRTMGRMMRKMGKEMGEDMPPEFDDMLDRLEAGQSPEEIKSALPDPGSETGGGEDE